MDRALKSLPMGISTKDSIQKGSQMDMASTIGQTEATSKEILSKD